MVDIKSIEQRARRLARAVDLSLALVALMSLAGCGGGGGGNDSPTGSAEVSLDRTSISRVSIPGDTNLPEVLSLSVVDMPQAGVYVTLESTEQGLTGGSFDAAGSSTTHNGHTVQTASVQLSYKSGATLPDGQYEDDITVHVCYDDACTRPVKGSPLRVHSSLQVRYDAVTLTASQHVIQASATVNPTQGTGVHLDLDTSDRVRQGSLTYLPEFQSGAGAAISAITFVQTSETRTRMGINFDASGRPPGVYQESVRVRVCYDAGCQRPMTGSPMTFDVRFEVVSNIQPEAGLPALPVASRIQLTHDIAAAAYSRPLGLVLMTANAPAPALYLYDTRNGTEKQLALPFSVSALSLSSDGTKVAVAHPRGVSYIDVTTVGTPSPTSRYLASSVDVDEVVLDDQGVVHVFQRRALLSDSGAIRSIDTATGVERQPALANTTGYETRALLLPNSPYLYGVSSTVDAYSVVKNDVSQGYATFLYNSEGHGLYPICNDLWLTDTANRLITQCGAMFSASASNGDLRYLGTLPLTPLPDSFNGRTYAIASLDHSSAAHQVALIERDHSACAGNASIQSCYSHLALYEDTGFSRTALYALTPIELDGAAYVQVGLFVFYEGATSPRKVLLSQAPGRYAPASEYFLSLLN